ncbi:MAG: peptide chain release factor N(5)-glutamine methyltransferase [Ruminococcus sp.]|nr:peptide chain release factor N(5)-glutamine methyltransferase [Ruminococcus sp.]
MVSRKELYNECADMLKNYGNPNAEFDTLCIFQDIFDEKNPLFRPMEAVSQENEKTIREYVKKRSEGYPLQYILGKWEFYGYNFRISPDVLIPRPDTEVLVENVLEICRKEGKISPVIYDLCSGSGCIAVTLKKEIPSAEVYAVEISQKAVDIIKQNSALNNADINIINSNVIDPEFTENLKDIDIIVCNPPYLTQEDMDTLQKEVTFEPELALFGGADGLSFYREITAQWKKCLKKGGYLCYEFGYDQHEDVKNILVENKFENIKLTRDLAGIIRTVTAQKPIKQED